MELTRGTAQSCSGGLAALAARLASCLADDNADSNLVFSPLSIYAALALLAAGARGATLDEILGVLGAPSRAALDEFLSLVADDALKDHAESGGPCVAFACGVWTDLTCPLKPAYRHAAVSTYKAEASTVDFRNNPEGARGQINQWVAQVTRNLISSVLGPGSITPLTRVVLGNAIYFKGKWEKPFYKKITTNKLFYRLDAAPSTCPSCRAGVLTSQFIAVHEGFKVLKLRYQMGESQDRRADHNKRTQFSMCIVLPDAIDGLRNLIDTIASQPGFLRKHMPTKKVDVREFRVPKFKLSFRGSVVAILKKLGLQLPFSEQADLSDIVEGDESGLPLVPTDIIHQAVIEVDEEGTQAAAVTCMSFQIGSSPRPPTPPPRVDFVADHPFAYFVMEEAAGAVVFVGYVLDPSKED